MTLYLEIIEELLERTDHLIYLASGAFQNRFARIYLARFGYRVIYRDIRTEVGLINKDNGTIFTTSGINITSTRNATVVQLPVETFDTHNYLAASDVIIAKSGWGTLSEALLSKSNLVLIEREGVLEDTENIEELKRRGVTVSIKETDLARIDMFVIKDLIARNIIRENQDVYENTAEEVVPILILNSHS